MKRLIQSRAGEAILHALRKAPEQQNMLAKLKAGATREGVVAEQDSNCSRHMARRQTRINARDALRLEQVLSEQIARDLQECGDLKSLDEDEKSGTQEEHGRHSRIAARSGLRNSTSAAQLKWGEGLSLRWTAQPKRGGWCWQGLPGTV